MGMLRGREKELCIICNKYVATKGLTTCSYCRTTGYGKNKELKEAIAHIDEANLPKAKEKQLLAINCDTVRLNPELRATWRMSLIMQRKQDKNNLKKLENYSWVSRGMCVCLEHKPLVEGKKRCADCLKRGKELYYKNEKKVKNFIKLGIIKICKKCGKRIVPEFIKKEHKFMGGCKCARNTKSKKQTT